MFSEKFGTHVHMTYTGVNFRQLIQVHVHDMRKSHVMSCSVQCSSLNRTAELCTHARCLSCSNLLICQYIKVVTLIFYFSWKLQFMV